jgi:hypothetical protein
MRNEDSAEKVAAIADQVAVDRATSLDSFENDIIAQYAARIL